MERAGQLYRDWFNAAVQDGGMDPRQQILAVFDALTKQVQPGQCRGCPFLMTLAEFPDPAHPAHRSAVALKQWVRTRLAELTTALGPAQAANRDALADELALVMEGVYGSVQALGVSGPARRARAFAEALLAAGNDGAHAGAP